MTTLKAVLRPLLPNAVGPRRIIAGPLKGRRLVTSWRHYPAAILGYTELPLLRWLSSNVTCGETWLDVGAHYGYTALALSTLVGAAGRVFAFEPVLGTAGHLSLTRSLNRLPQLTVVPVGLSEAGDLTAINVPVVRGMADHNSARLEPAETILVIALDRIWPRLAGENPLVHGIKVDVQGMEIEALIGMREVLREFHPSLIVEFHNGVDRSAVLSLIEAAGYDLPGATIDGLSVAKEPMYLDDTSYAFSPRRP